MRLGGWGVGGWGGGRLQHSCVVGCMKESPMSGIQWSCQMVGQSSEGAANDRTQCRMYPRVRQYYMNMSIYEGHYMNVNIHMLILWYVSIQECQYIIYESRMCECRKMNNIDAFMLRVSILAFGNVWLSTFTKRGRLSFRRKIPRQTFFGESFIRMGSKSWKRKCHKNKEDPCTLKTADLSYSVYSPVHGFV